MSLERADTSQSIAFPEPATMDRDGYNVTGLSIGSSTRKVIEGELSLTEALNTFTRISPPTPAESRIVMLPGLTNPGNIYFERQEEELLRNGTEIVYVDYSQKHFSQDLLMAQLSDYVSQAQNDGKPTTLLGLSLGSAFVVDYVMANQDAAKQLDGIVLLGPIYSYDDVNGSVFKKLLKLAQNHTPRVVVNKMVPVIKAMMLREPALFGGDPTRLDLIKDVVKEINLPLMLDRAKSLQDKAPLESLPTQPEVRTLLVPWEQEYIAPTKFAELGRIFPDHKTVVLPGKHGYTGSSAEALNEALVGFIRSDQTNQDRLVA